MYLQYKMFLLNRFFPNLQHFQIHYLQYKMFLLNHEEKRRKQGIWDEFTIQNVPIKFLSHSSTKFDIRQFTIQNVPIKS